MTDIAELNQMLTDGATEMMAHVDQDLLAEIGSTVTAWAAGKPDGWTIAQTNATLIDSLCYMIARYVDPPQRRLVLATAAAAITITGVQFIRETEAQERKEAMN